MLVLVTIVVIAYFYYHVTAFLEPDWRALYSAPGHGPYTHLTRPLLAFCARGDWLARLVHGMVACSTLIGEGMGGMLLQYTQCHVIIQNVAVMSCFV